MSVINILSPHVADLIAAGEVVERPASVIKELVENSVDAGAKNISIEIRGGGMTYIRVTDDGGGMSPEDAGVAFLRHATSKLKDERGLESIATLGFRGEALAAISAVSRIELLTRQKGDGAGTRVALTAGDIDEMGPEGCPEGTTMIVRDLFYNTPARLKFSKSDRAEGSACVNTALRCALGHPDVSIRMIKDGQEEFFSPGDGQKQSCVYSLLGRETALNMLACSGGDEGISVDGFISAPHACRGNRAMQFFFINGRPFRSAALQAAVEQAYKSTMLTGRFPVCVLYLTVSFGKVDVNVHPTKSEVKFSEEKKVFDAVYYSALSALSASQGQSARAEIKLSPTTEKAVGKSGQFFKHMSAEEFRSSGAGSSKSASGSFSGVSAAKSAVPAAKNVVVENAQSAPAPFVQSRLSLEPTGESLSLHQTSPDYKASRTYFIPRSAQDAVEAGRGNSDSPNGELPFTVSDPASKPSGEAPGNFDCPSGSSAEAGEKKPADAEEAAAYANSASEKLLTGTAAASGNLTPEADGASGNSAPEADAASVNAGIVPESPAVPEYRLVGEAMNTYIIVECGEELVLIDKHAAHERVIFDRLMGGGASVMSQTMLVPVTCGCSAGDMELLEENAELLEKAGFEIEAYGGRSVIIRAVPADVDDDAGALLEELLEGLRSGRKEDRLETIFHTVACKAAIKAGWLTEPSELRALAERVLSGEVRYCPHGRPVSVRLTKKELDRQFKRIV